MADKHPVGFTFHKIREQAEQGSSAAWRAFLDFYSPLYLKLLALYLPDVDLGAGVWQQTLRLLATDNFAHFRATARQSEREFLSDIRAFLIDAALDTKPAADNEESPTVNVEELATIVAGLPLLHQEILFFKLAGYTDATLELVMRVAPQVAQASFERLAPAYAAAQKLERDRCLWPAPWLQVLQKVRTLKTDKCPHLHQFLRIQDGQVSWYDKEPLETHVTQCLHCLAAWTALREVGYWRREAPPVPASLIEEFLPALQLGAPPRQSLLQRVFGH